MWIQKANYTSQPSKKSMPHLPRNKHGEGCVCLKTARSRRVGALAVLCLAALVGQAGAAEPTHVTAVRFWSLSGVTRIAIETDGDFELKSDRLDSPDRLFFDLRGTKPTLSHKAMTVIPVADHFVKQIRVAEPQSNITRVVLDLEGQVEPTTSRLENPTRLIIELRAPGGAPETTKAPVKAPTLVAPNPAPKPAERRPFTPPPAPQPVAIPVVQTQEAWLEQPPQLPSPRFQSRNTAPTVPALLSMNAKPGAAPARAVPVTVLAKPVSTSISNLAASTPVASTPAEPGETALPAKRNSSGDRSMIRALGLKVGRIVLDPGHGGHDTGSVGPEGLREKDLVLDVAQKLGHLIEERMGSEVIYTRSDDTFVPRERRTEIANEAKADLFLSIHANSSPLRNAAGVETYYLNFTTQRSALDLASRENSGSQMSVYELQELLQKIALKDKVEESREFASRVQTAMSNLAAKTGDSRAKDRGVKRAPFIVLIGASMPSVLAEIGFVSNAHDENIMRREENRERIAEALYKGISGYANSLSHFQVAQRH
jgi:N-acetylmuramoyl-L-alanine amidase